MRCSLRFQQRGVRDNIFGHERHLLTAWLPGRESTREWEWSTFRRTILVAEESSSRESTSLGCSISISSMQRCTQSVYQERSRTSLWKTCFEWVPISFTARLMTTCDYVGAEDDAYRSNYHLQGVAWKETRRASERFTDDTPFETSKTTAIPRSSPNCTTR